MGPGWAAPWASMDALGTRGRATMAGGGHFSQVLTLWWGLSTGEATPSFLSFTPPPPGLPFSLDTLLAKPKAGVRASG